MMCNVMSEIKAEISLREYTDTKICQTWCAIEEIKRSLITCYFMLKINPVNFKG